MRVFDISATNLHRALRWHPQGLNSWSEADWGCALAGEVGEVFEAHNEGMSLTTIGAELADVWMYLDLFAQRCGFSLAQAAADFKGQTFIFNGIDGRLLALGQYTGKMLDIVKKLNRTRDLIPGNRVTDDALRESLYLYAGATAHCLDGIAQFMGLDLHECVRSKFNFVSERMNFPERL